MDDGLQFIFEFDAFESFYRSNGLLALYLDLSEVFRARADMCMAKISILK